MPREGWGKRQAENTRRNVAVWPDWMRREGIGARDPEMERQLVEELAAKLRSVAGPTDYYVMAQTALDWIRAQ